MKPLVKHVMRAAVIANWNHLVLNCWSPRKMMDLYGDLYIPLIFHISPMIKEYAKCSESNYSSVSWRNNLYSRGKIFIIIIQNFNVFTINLQFFLLNVWGRLREQETRTPSLVHPTIYSPPGPLPSCVHQPLSCGLDNTFYS